MSPHPRAGLEAHEAVRLRRGRGDDLPDVDAHPVREHRELVHQRDVHRAEDVLEKLRELRHLGRRDTDDLLADEAVELLGAVAAGLREPANHLRGVREREVGAARVDAFGREREVEVDPGAQPAGFEQRSDALARRAGIGGRFDHHELAGRDKRSERLRARQQGTQIRLAVRGERRRHADEDRVAGGERRVVRGGLEAPAHLRERPVGDVLDVGVPVGDRLDLARVDIDAQDLGAGLREADCERQPDVAESDDADAH